MTRREGSGITGEQIRREREESRARSRFGRPTPIYRQLQPHLSIIVRWVGIDWVVVLAACALRGFGKVGLVLAAFTLALDVGLARIVTIWSDAGDARVVIARPLQRASRATAIGIDAPVLRYWNAWNCRGFELHGTNVSILASTRRGSRLSPPLGVRAIATPPSLRLTTRAVLLNLPNILLTGVSIVAVWNVSGYSLLVMLLAIQSLASSLASCVLGTAIVDFDFDQGADRVTHLVRCATRRRVAGGRSGRRSAPPPEPHND